MPSDNTNENLDPFNTTDSDTDRSSPTDPPSSPSPFDNTESNTDSNTNTGNTTDTDNDDLPEVSTNSNTPDTTSTTDSDVPATPESDTDSSYSVSFLYPLVNKLFSAIGTGFYTIMNTTRTLFIILFGLLYVFGAIPGAIIAGVALLYLDITQNPLAFLGPVAGIAETVLSIALLATIILLVRHAVIIDNRHG